MLDELISVQRRVGMQRSVGSAPVPRWPEVISTFGYASDQGVSSGAPYFLCALVARSQSWQAGAL